MTIKLKFHRKTAILEFLFSHKIKATTKTFRLRRKVVTHLVRWSLVPIWIDCCGIKAGSHHAATTYDGRLQICWDIEYFIGEVHCKLEATCT